MKKFYKNINNYVSITHKGIEYKSNNGIFEIPENVINEISNFGFEEVFNFDVDFKPNNKFEDLTVQNITIIEKIDTKKRGKK